MDPYYWFGLKSVPQVGNVTFRRLLSHFGSPERVLSATAGELAAVRGVTAAASAQVLAHDWRPFAEREKRLLEASAARVVTILDEEYPKVLMEIPDPPPFLYVVGSLKSSETAIGVVGSRRASSYGLMTTEKLARELAAAGVTVISGMARGVDSAAHRGALKAGGRSVGILGCGIDVRYPPENGKLFDEMAEQGALVSELPLGTQPLAENFPRRNRIIAGLSCGILVVEAAEKSGSLITADCALEYGREVFAIPGNINSYGSRGTNRLIKQGAKLVEQVEDILEEFPAVTGKPGECRPPSFSFDPTEADLYALIAPAPLHIDEIIVKSALTVGEVSAILLRLELKGAVTQLPGKFFSVAG